MVPPPPSRNSPTPNPFFTGSVKSPRSSISGKDSLGRIPSLSSLKNTAEKINSPARRISSNLATATTTKNSSTCENEKPKAFQLGKHFYSYDDIASLETNVNASAGKRKSPRKNPRIREPSSELLDVDDLLAVQKTLFKLRSRIFELISVGDYFSAHHWLKIIFEDSTMKEFTHWADWYRFFSLCQFQPFPVSIILEAFRDYEGRSAEPICAYLVLVKLELLVKAAMWDEALVEFERHDFDTLIAALARPAMKNWEKEQFPSDWVPNFSPDTLRSRLYHFYGLVLRNLGSFEKAIDAFDLATQYNPFNHASVAEMICESNALIPAGQRKQYLETLALGGGLTYSQEIDDLFNRGKYDQVLRQTRPYFLNSSRLLDNDTNLLVLHLGSLYSLKLADELFLMAQKLVSGFPGRGIAWYAVGLYYEAIDKPDDSRRYLMKACSKEETFSPAWLMLGHSFSKSGDYDQAVSAYALLARHSAPASLFPRLFLAMEFLKTKQIQSANMYLIEAFNAEKTNPWIMNEIGIMYYLQKNCVKAIAMLNNAYLMWKKLWAAGELAHNLGVSILTNIVSVYIKFLPSAQNLMVEAIAASRAVQELLLQQHHLSQLPTQSIITCAALLEIRATFADLEEGGDGGVAFLAKAADLYHEVLLRYPDKPNKMALLGYNRCLVLKVQNMPIAHPDDHWMDAPSCGEEDDGDADEMVMATPVKACPTQVQSSPLASPEQPSASRPPTLRRRLTNLSFDQADEEDL